MHILPISCACVVLLSLSSVAEAQGLIVEHRDAVDPITEGFVAVPPVSPVVTSGVIADQGFDAWRIDDSGPASLAYSDSLNSAELASVSTLGWHLRTILRLTSAAPDDPEGSIGVFFRPTSTTSWQLHFGSNAIGNLVIRVPGQPGGSVDIVLTTSAATYHTIDYILEPTDLLASAYVDGVPVGNFTPWTAATSFSLEQSVGFGAFSSPDVGSAHYHLVAFTSGVPGTFSRGNADGDTTLAIGDVVDVLAILFVAGATPDCLDAADINDDGNLSLVDPIYLLEHLFGSGPLPPGPTSCGVDPTPSNLDCDTSVCP